MTKPAGFWNRVRKMFTPERTADSDGSVGVIESAVVDAADVPEAPPLDESAARETSWLRRSGTQQMRDVSQRMIALADAMQTHFEQQDERAADLVRSLGRVSDTLENLAESQKSHTDILKAIAAQTEATGKHTAALSDTVGRIPDSLLTQAEAIRTVGEQVRQSQEMDGQLMQSLGTFSRAIDALGSAGSAQVQTLQKLSTAQHDQHEAFTALVREQTKRFVIVLVIAGVVGVAALIGLIVALVQQSGG